MEVVVHSLLVSSSAIAFVTERMAGMRNWGSYFGLINTRHKAARDEEFWDNQHAFVYFTPEITMPRSRFQALPPWEKAEATAAAIGLGMDRAVVSGRAAARLLGIEVHDWRDATVDLTYRNRGRPPGRSRRQKGARYRSVYLPEEQVVTEHSISVTRIYRTLRDIAAWYGVLEGVVAMDSARRQWPGLTREKLRDNLLTGPRFKGKDNVRRAIDLSVPNAGSPKETHARYLLLLANLPGVETIELQVEVLDEVSGARYVIDLVINGWIAVEIDGGVKYDGVTYGGTDDTVLQEREREKRLQNVGYLMLRTGDPEEVVGLVSSALAREAREPRWHRRSA